MAKKKKSAAQIRRMQLRAEKRGEQYVPPEPAVEEEAEDTSEAKPAATNSSKSSPNNKMMMMKAALKLKRELTSIQTNDELRAKERRSYKRKAEAIAAEEAGCSPEELQQFLEEHQETLDQQLEKTTKKKKVSKDKNNDTNDEERRRTPYIVFVGQLAYTTTPEGLWGHIDKELSDEHEITKETVKVRLLTNAKTQQSKGMAFVELDNPELMYACLRLHHTLLDGRRLNVERSAGGRKNETRQAKLKEYRQQQDDYISNVMDTILGDYIRSGELQEGELDEGAVAMCKRYSANMVETAIKQYIETNGRTMDNTSAYFSFLLGKLATDKAEGVADNDRPSKRPKKDGPPPKSSKDRTKIAPQSSLPGVDFSTSEPKEADNNLSQIFPSLARGRGRGRGYM